MLPGGQSGGQCGFAGVWLVDCVHRFGLGSAVSVDFVNLEVEKVG